MERGQEAHAEWQKSFDDVGRPRARAQGAVRPPEDPRPCPRAWEKALPSWEPDRKEVSTRKASGEVLNALADVLPELWGGSADLAEINNTTMEGAALVRPRAHGRRTLWKATPYGRTLHFGIREHAMGAILSGIALHGPTRPYGGTFLIFRDYMRGAVRLASLMQVPVVYVWTHDSIGLGEDGPTHQPIEHMAAAAGDPGPFDGAPRRRHRDRGCLEGDPGAQRGAVRDRADPPEHPGARRRRRTRASRRAATSWPTRRRGSRR